MGREGASLTTPVIMRGATSPAPRAIARMTPVMTPGRAPGRAMRWIICHLDAPQARAASRTPRGTDERASSVATMTTGRVMSARVREAQRMPPVPKVGEGSLAWKKPSK